MNNNNDQDKNIQLSFNFEQEHNTNSDNFSLFANHYNPYSAEEQCTLAAELLDMADGDQAALDSWILLQLNELQLEIDADALAELEKLGFGTNTTNDTEIADARNMLDRIFAEEN
jgi:hypothetical protein